MFFFTKDYQPLLLLTPTWEYIILKALPAGGMWAECSSGSNHVLNTETWQSAQTSQQKMPPVNNSSLRHKKLLSRRLTVIRLSWRLFEYFFRRLYPSRVGYNLMSLFCFDFGFNRRMRKATPRTKPLKYEFIFYLGDLAITRVLFPSLQELVPPEMLRYT